MVTIKTVAKKAGVSIGTVSNTLSGNRPVSDKVRQRVMQAIDELGYQTDMIASSMVTGRSKTIGAVMASFQLGLGSLLAGIDAGAREQGFSLLVSRLGDDEDPIGHLHALSGRRVDGVIWVVPETEDSHRWIESAQIDSNIPIVFAFGSSHLQHSSIWMDNLAGGYAATRHLIEHGCRKIGHISGPLEYLEAKERKAGWEKALSEADIEPTMLCEGDWYAEGGKNCISYMLEQWPDIEAVFVSSDNGALGAISALQKSGRRIPEDVKVIGFDDVRFLDYTNPPLTSIRQDYFRMGDYATKELCRRIEHPESEAQVTIIPTQLIIRQSCGCENEELS
jgi:DNA-binding LacI/PurR family transcriptional regulator